jgi:chromosome segregation ATPase
MTTEIIWNSFADELEKHAFSGAAVKHTVGRVGAEFLSGGAARVSLRSTKTGLRRADKALQTLQAELRKAKPPKQGVLESQGKYKARVTEFSKRQRGMSQAVTDMKQQTKILKDHGKALESHITDLRTNPWTSDLRLPK